MNTLYHGDCLELLDTLDLSDVRLVLTDPPYGRNVELRSTNKHLTILNDHAPNVGQTLLDWAAERDLATVAFASPKQPWLGTWRQTLIWDKGPAVGMGDTRRTWKPSYELIQVARNTPLRGKRDGAVLRYPISSHFMREHPCRKPVGMLRYLIEQLTDPGDLVFDPFAGIGSTGVACQESGRRFVGIELDPHYHQMAARALGIGGGDPGFRITAFAA